MRTKGYLLAIGLFRAVIFGLLVMNVGCYAPGGWVANRTGMRQYNRGHYAQARNRFAHAVAHDPANPDYRHNLAMAIQKQGDPVSAEKIFRHNLTIDAMHQPTYHSLAQLMVAQGRAPEAQELIAGWAATQPYIPEANIEMAWIQRESGDYAGAEQSLQTALRADPTNPIALGHMGQLYQVAGRNDQAVAYYQRSLASNWDQPEVQSRLETLVESGPQTRSALMQNPVQSPMMASNAPMMMVSDPMMAGAPVTMGGPMMASAPVSAEPMVANISMMSGDTMVGMQPPAGFDASAAGNPTMIAAPPMTAEMPFGSDPSAAALEDVKANRAPRKKHARRHRRDRDDASLATTYPLPDFGGAPTTMAWMPTGSIGGQPAMAYQVNSFPTNSSWVANNSPQIPAPQLADSLATPYGSNSSGMIPAPQADPAHFSESNPEMTASGPTVDPH